MKKIWYNYRSETVDFFREGECIMFQKGDHVIYKNNGVCLVEDVRPLSFGTIQREYYILRPLNNEGTVYVPTDSGENTPKLKKIPTSDEIDALIDQTEHSDLKWIENSKMRIVAFDKLLSSSDRASILWLLKMLSVKKKEEAARNKKLCANEERILTAAEKIITEEFSFALGLPKEDVVPYILRQIEKK